MQLCLKKCYCFQKEQHGSPGQFLNTSQICNFIAWSQIKHKHRVFCIISEKQSAGLHRHEKQVCHAVEIFDAVAVAGLNCKPQGPIHRPSSFPFVYLQCSELSDFHFQPGRSNPILRSQHQTFSLTSAVLRLHSGDATPKEAAASRRALPAQPQHLSVMAAVKPSHMQFTEINCTKGIYKSRSIPLKRAKCRHFSVGIFSKGK